MADAETTHVEGLMTQIAIARGDADELSPEFDTVLGIKLVQVVRDDCEGTGCQRCTDALLTEEQRLVNADLAVFISEFGGARALERGRLLSRMWRSHVERSRSGAVPIDENGADN